MNTSSVFPRRARRALVSSCAALLLAVVALPRLGERVRAQADVDSAAPSLRNRLKTEGADARPGEILVRFRADAPAVRKGEAVSSLALRVAGGETNVRVERFDPTETVAGLRLARVAPEETAAAIEALRARADVVYAEPNFRRYKTTAPNDARYAEQWALKNTGQLGGTAGADIGAEAAWNTTTGDRSIVVAVIDEGIDVSHPDLAANVWHNPGEVAGNGIDDDGDGYVDDVNGYDFFHNDGSVYDGPGTTPDGFPVDAHGTHVAGIVGAAGNNGAGVAGVAWQTSIMSLKFLGPDGGSAADAVRAYGYAKMMRDKWLATNGAQGANVLVTNNSYGGGGSSQAEIDAIRALGDSDILFVASAGNESENNDSLPSFPASYDLPNVISVASTTRQDQISSFSNTGARTVHLAAPGSEILSTFPGNTYATASGTSMAAPQVSGVAALVLAARPYNVRRTRAALLFGGDLITAADGRTVTGRRLSAAGSIANALHLDEMPPAPAANLHVTSVDWRTASLAWTEPGDDGNTGRAALTEVFFDDAATGARFRLYVHRPSAAGAAQSAVVQIPFRHSAGSLVVRTTDAAGNTSDASVAVSDAADAAEPYTMTVGGPAPLTAGGTPLNFHFDDNYTNYQLPFAFPFFDRYANSINLSSNGAIYVGNTPLFDLPNIHEALAGRNVIAGLWEDLDLRTSRRADADIYLVTPNSDTIIFRWQGVDFFTGNPVNFEIELRRDGTIVERYGDGNVAVGPVVGIGGGEPDPYLVATHTSELAPINLTNAPSVTYTMRRLPKKADLRVAVTDRPNPVAAGQNITYTVTVTNAGPDAATGVSVRDEIPFGATFVSCATAQGACTGRAPGLANAFAASLDTIPSGGSASATFVVTTPPAQQSSYTNVATAAAATYDPSTFNNSATSSTQGALANPNPLRGAVAVEAGDSHYLVLTTDGEALARGSNFAGQLGDGSTTDRTTPVYVRNLLGARALSAGRAHNLAVKANGTVAAWGSNFAGQLGDGTQIDRRTPVVVQGLAGVTMVSAGATHSLALKSDGTVWAWGNNGQGQLGDGTNTSRTTPVQVAGLANVVSVAAGEDHSVAVRSDGTVWTWGSGSFGQLCDPSASRNAPAQLGGLTGFSSASAGISYSLLLRNDGSVWSCGANGVGQLGDGTHANHSTPQQIAGLAGVTAISAGSAHALALRGDGTVWSWGQNNQGQLGTGYNATPNGFEPSPVQVLILADARGVSAGGGQSLAVRADGSVVSWGANSVFGQPYPYGVNPPNNRPTLAPLSFNPDGGSFASAQQVTVTSPDAAAQIASITPAGGHVLAIMSDGTARAWGSNSSGQLGVVTGGQSSSDNYSATPVAVRNLSNVRALAGGGSMSVALKTDGTVWTWGFDWYGAQGHLTDLPEQVAGVADAVQIACGTQHGLVRRADGTVWGWGYNGLGQLGDGTTTDRPSLVRVGNLTNVVSITTTSDHNFALKSDGTLWAWGYNRIGQIGDGSSTVKTSPVQLSISNVTQIATGTIHTVALRSDGTVWTWGGNENGQLGDGTSTSKSSPVQVAGLSGVVAVAARGNSSMALKSDGTVWAWGTNLVGFSPAWNLTPVQIAGLPAVASVAAGGGYAVARTQGGAYWVWGSNDKGVFGNGTASGPISPVTPAQMDWLAAGATIHYTLDGTQPTDTDPVVASGATVLVDHTATLKARAIRDGYAPGSIKQAGYTIGGATNATVQFAAQSFSASEGAGRVSITVTRAGDTAGASSVRFSTVDDQSPIRCDDTTTKPGVSFARCDYATTVQTINFAPGETQKTVSVPLIDDGFAEGPETFQLSLSDPQGATVASPAAATVTIQDNDAPGAPNPIFNTDFFVRMQYLDFLSREPEPGQPWSNVLNNCAAGDTACDRISVSANFFRSQEFQLKGLFVFRFYKVAFGRMPLYTEIIPDMSSVTGTTTEEVNAKKDAYTNAFGQRQEFANLYGGMTNQQYVDALMNRYGLQMVTIHFAATNGTILTAHVERAGFVNGLNNGTYTRAQVVRMLVECDEIAAAEFNPAWVAMQYFGYLRRDPDAGGYQAWLNTINANPNDFRSMVNGFMNSVEYRLRFGTP